MIWLQLELNNLNDPEIIIITIIIYKDFPLIFHIKLLRQHGPSPPPHLHNKTCI